MTTTQITQQLTCPNPDCSGETMYAFRINGEAHDRDDLDLDEYMYDPVRMNHIFKCLKCKTHVLGCPKCSEGYGVIFDDYDEDGDALDLYPVTDKYFEEFKTVPMTFLGYDGDRKSVV